MATAQAFARKAAIAVIAADRLETLLGEATAARAAYLVRFRARMPARASLFAPGSAPRMLW